MSVKLTDTAVSKIKEILAENKLESDKTFVRVGIAGQGCSGNVYSFALDEEYSTEEDTVISEDGGLKVICDNDHVKGLMGVFVDYVESEKGRGFAFHDPMRVMKGEGGGCCGGSSGGCSSGGGGCGSK